jgi:nucleotide-binding universal stress UspA family protein
MKQTLAYKSICLSTDLSQYSHYIGNKALSLPFSYENFTVFHVVEPPVMYTHAFAEFNQLLIALKTQAQSSLQAYLSALELPPEAGIIEMGSTKNSIIDYIKKNKIDLLILGSHGVGGLSHLIGSTASYVVANAPCDVWMIHVEKADKETLTPSAFANPAQAYPSELIKKIKPAASLIPDPNASLAPSDRFGVKQHPVFSGSEKGIKQDTKRGPHLTIRPKGAPSKGQSREEDENNPPEKNE